MANHKYIIKVDGNVIWEGLDLPRKFRDISRKFPHRKISVAWVPTKEDILIV